MDYAHAFGERYYMKPEDLGMRLSARAQRQRAVAGTPYTAFVGEPALRTVVGDKRVMAAQLAALLAREHTTVQVVPDTTTAHLGQLGAFMLLRFSTAPTVVHVELLRTGVFLDDPKLTAPYEDAVNQVAGVALSETESTHLIGTIRREMETRPWTCPGLAGAVAAAAGCSPTALN